MASIMEAASVNKDARSTPTAASGADMRGGTFKIINRGNNQVLACTYAMRGCDEADTPDVITCMYLILGFLTFTLIDLGSHFVVCLL